MKNNSLNKARGCVYRLSVHIVFVTKYRRKVITKQILEDLEKIFKRLCENQKCQLTDFNAESDYIELRKVTTTTDLLFYIAIHLLCFYVNKVSYTLMTLLHNVHKEKLYIV